MLRLRNIQVRRFASSQTNNDGYEQLTQLGRKIGLSASPDEAELEKVPNQHPDSDYCARFTCPEFTSLCPVTGKLA